VNDETLRSADGDDAELAGADHSEHREEAPSFAVVVQLGSDQLGDHEQLATLVDHGVTRSIECVVFATDLELSNLNELRPAIRLTHERGRQAWVRLEWTQLGLDGLDLAAPAAGLRARAVAQELHRQLPEMDGVFLDCSSEAPPIGLPDLSRAFLDEFHQRTGFSGPRYRLEARMSELSAAAANPRVRLDFANACEDFAFRLLSNLVTEAAARFHDGLRWALVVELLPQLLLRPFDWLPNWWRFTRLGSLVFGGGDAFELALARSLDQCGQPTLLRDESRLQRFTPAASRVALVVNPHAALANLELGRMQDDLAAVASTLSESGLAFDVLTPEQMTTSQMTETGGFARGEVEYLGAVLVWPTVFTPYEWRELNVYLEEHGRAARVGPRPVCLTDGTPIAEEAKNRFRTATIDFELMIDEVARRVTAFSGAGDSAIEPASQPAIEAVSSDPQPSPSPTHDVD